MRAILKSIILDNFKGVKHAEYDFNNGVVIIKGENGTGKTTVGTAFMWVLCDTDMEMNGKPTVAPDGNIEVTSTVVLNMNVDGKDISLTKYQKTRQDKDGKQTTTNGYMVNGVEKSATAFKAQLTELGFDFTKLAYLVNPSAFMREKSKDMRKILFEMSDSITDIDIAKAIDGVAETAKLLETYTLDEIEAMKKQELRKINEADGTNGDITSARIDEIVKSKVDYDVAELELAKKDLERKLADVDKRLNGEKVDTSEMLQREIEIKFRLAEIKTSMNGGIEKNRKAADDEICKCLMTIQAAESTLATTKKMMELADRELADIENQKQAVNADYKEMLTRQFDDSPYQFKESDSICPACGRELDEGKVRELRDKLITKRETDRQAFLSAKDREKEALLKRAKSIKDRESELNKQKNDYEKRISDSEKQISEETEVKASFEKLKADMPDTADYTSNNEYNALVKELEELHAKIEKINSESNNGDTEALEEEMLIVQSELDEVRNKLAQVANNDKIDERVEQLRKQLQDYAQQRSNCEKILDQIKEINRYKNTAQENDVNSNFSIVKWRLYRYQKNGEPVDDCTPTIDGFAYGKSTNHGREILAKLDICYSLQRYYNAYLPVFADDMESLDEDKYLTQEGTQLFALVREKCKFTIEGGQGYCGREK